MKSLVIETTDVLKSINIKEAEIMYLDYVNNFLSIERFAEYYSITFDSATRIIEFFRNL